MVERRSDGSMSDKLKCVNVESGFGEKIKGLKVEKHEECHCKQAMRFMETSKLL